MKTSKRHSEIPEEVLQRWWWRRLVFVKFDETTHTTNYRINVPEYPGYSFSGEWSMWHRKDELIAFRCELLRRTSFPDLPEWQSLPAWLHGLVSGVVAPKGERTVCGKFFPSAPMGYASLDSWMWDLTASDESLCRFFISRINEKRRTLGLPATNDPFISITGNRQKHTEKRRGERNRQVSWLAVEAHDIKSFAARQLTDGERSRLSKARREITVFVAPLKEALEAANQMPPEWKRNCSGENLYARFIRENFLRRFASQLPKQ